MTSSTPAADATAVAAAADDDASALAELAAGIGGNGVAGGRVGKPWVRAPKGKAKKGGKAGGDGAWAWRSDVASYYAVVGGLEKLQRERPSTGFFGNGDVIEGMRALSDTIDDATCRLVPFMGKTKPPGAAAHGFVKLADADSEEVIDEQWSQLPGA